MLIYISGYYADSEEDLMGQDRVLNEEFPRESITHILPKVMDDYKCIYVLENLANQYGGRKFLLVN